MFDEIEEKHGGITLANQVHASVRTVHTKGRDVLRVQIIDGVVYVRAFNRPDLWESQRYEPLLSDLYYLAQRRREEEDGDEQPPPTLPNVDFTLSASDHFYAADTLRLQRCKGGGGGGGGKGKQRRRRDDKDNDNNNEDDGDAQPCDEKTPSTFKMVWIESRPKQRRAEDRYQVLIPGYEFCELTHRGAWPRTLGDAQRVAAHFDTRYPWSRKLKAGAWRGTLRGLNTGPREWARDGADGNDRLRLVNMTRDVRTRVDARFVVPLMPRHLSAMPVGASIAQNDFARYAVVLDVDGGGWSARLPHLMLMNSVVMKMASAHDTVYQRVLQRERGIVWFCRDLSDLAALIEHYATNESAARAQIARQRDFVYRHLLPRHTRAYWRAALARYAALQRFEVRRDPRAIEFVPCAAHARSMPACSAHFIPGIDAKCATAGQQCVFSYGVTAKYRGEK